ncbi:CdaR family protein [Ihubacter sp. rT4E-8]|uniref:CdaR family protein n=1 Tax=Ihubacter sp. rT4E-8 TaxID=3242369 RepID=UPI003CF2133F
MLANKRFNIILSLIIAICLWAYVIGETNPTDTRTFRDIPIVLVGEQTLEDNDLALLSVSAETINVTLTGARANINQIEDRDIFASVNLAEAAKGESQLKINLRVPDNVEIEDKSLNKLTVMIEDRISREVDIQVNYQGNFGEDEEPIIVDMSRTSTVVTGAASLVESVEYVEALVESGKVKEQLNTVTCALNPVDGEGEIVNRVSLSAKTIQVSAQLAMIKTVPLIVPIEDSQNEDVPKILSAPKTITIKGKGEDLANIDTIETEKVDLSDVTKDTQINLQPILPEDVQISSRSQDNLVMRVKVTPLESRTFTFDEKNIELTGLREDQKAEIKPVQIEVVLKGRKEDLDAIVDDGFKLTADLKDLKVGIHTVILKVSCHGNYVSMGINPDHIKVTIE